jgi:glycosyltransferase involved in cell wall biosynthesis
MIRIHHVNLQPFVGGGEVFTRALTRAFVAAGAEVTLYCHPRNAFWRDLASGRVALRAVEDERALPGLLPRERSLVLTESPIPVPALQALAASHRLAGFAHMPLFQRSGDNLRPYHLLATVSRYCVELLRKAGLPHVYPEPVYGSADVARSDAPLVRRSPLIVDRRKLRDVALGGFESLFTSLFGAEEQYSKRPGVTLGVVSLISPIKQFPALFGILAPQLAKHPHVNLEIFGNGSYAQLRDLRRALAPLAGRARFWGYQANVATIYPQLDWLLTGLPEKEALGLNAIEAQACGTPVLAPDAPPFTETVQDGASGFRYRDPRSDGGAHFAAIVQAIVQGLPRPDPRIAAREHLAQFSEAALVERARRLLAALSDLE